MKTKVKFSIAAILFMAVVTITGCKKNSPTPPPPPPPTPVPATVTIKNYDHLTMSGVTVNYTILVNDSKISEAGVLFSTKTDSTTAQKLPANTVNQTMSSFLTGLKKNTRYNIWAYAKTAKGTIYSSKIKIWTYGLMDHDGNGYHTVKIGSQIWTVENLT